MIKEKLGMNPYDDNLKKIQVLLTKFKTHYCNGLAQSLPGNMYQVNFFLLILTRVMGDSSFRLSSDWNQAGSLDDATIERTYKDDSTGETKKSTHFNQLKSRVNVDKKTIGILDLFTVENKTDFYIVKYFKSIIGILNNDRFKNDKFKFCVVTNAHIKESLLNRQGDAKIFDAVDKVEFKKDNILYIDANSFQAIEYKLCNNSELRNKMKLSLLDTAINSKYISKFETDKKPDLLKNYLEDKKKVILHEIEAKQIEYTMKAFGGESFVQDIEKITKDAIKKKTKDDNKKKTKNEIEKKTKDAIKKKVEAVIKNKTVDQIKEIIDDVFESKLKFCTNKQHEQLKKDLESITLANKNEIGTRVLDFIIIKSEENSKKLEDSKRDLQKHQIPPLNVYILRGHKKKRNEIAAATEVNVIKQDVNDDLKICGGHATIGLSEKFKTKIQNCQELEEAKMYLDEELGEIILQIAIIEAAIDDDKFNTYMEALVNQFGFVTKFPNGDEMVDLIKGNLKDVCNLMNTDVPYASIFVKTLNYIKITAVKYNSNDFLTNQNDFYNDIKNGMNSMQISGISKDYVEHLRDRRIVFPESLTMPKVDAFLDNDSQVFHFFTKEPTTSANKLIHMFEKHEIYKRQDSFIFKDLSSIQSREQIGNCILNAFERDGCHNLLVINVENDDMNVEFFEKIKKILINSKAKVDEEKRMKLKRNQLGQSVNGTNNKTETKIKKILLIIKGSADEYRVENSIFISNNFEYHYEDDKNICYGDLTSSSQTELLERGANLQGNTKKLNELINENCARKKIFSEAEHLTRLLDKRELCFGNTNAFEPFVQGDYYVYREFHRQAIKSDVLKIKNQLFFITGVTEEYLKTLKKFDQTIKRWEDIKNDEEWKQFKSGIILHSVGQDNAQIFEMLQGDVHWLKFIESKRDFYWMDFKGEIKGNFFEQIVENYVPDDQDEFIKENYFCDGEGSKQKVVIIANNAGMGKTLLSINLTRQMNAANNGKWIIRYNFNDFGEDISSNPNEFNKDAIDFFVNKMAIPDDKNKNDVDIDIERKLLKCCLENEDKNLKMPKIVIMLDGFDEACPNHRDAATHLVKQLMDSAATQIYVTTRAHEKNHLERAFSSPAFNLKSWNKDDQTEFVHKFLKWNLKFKYDSSNKKVTKKRFEEIREYLKKVERSKGVLIPSISEILKKFPEEEKAHGVKELRQAIDQDLNLTEYIREFHQKWGDSINDRDNKFVSIPLHLRMLSEIIVDEEFTMPTDKGLLYLLQKYEKMKFKIHSQEKAEMKQNIDSASYINDRADIDMKRTLKALAVDLFFPHLTTNSEHLPCLDNLIDLYNEKTSLEERKNFVKLGIVTLKGNKFIFDHRVLAEYYFSQYLIDNLRDRRVQVLLFSKIFPYGGYKLICKFFDDHLKEEFKKVSTIELGTKALEMVMIDKDAILHSIFAHNYSNIYKFLLRSIRHAKGLHKIVTFFELYVNAPVYVRNVGTLDVFLEELLEFDDKTIKKECFIVMQGRSPYVPYFNSIRYLDVIDRLVAFLKQKSNKDRLGEELLKEILIQICRHHGEQWPNNHQAFEKLKTAEYISIIDEVLEHLRPYTDALRKVMLQVRLNQGNILSYFAKKIFSSSDKNSIEKATQTIAKIIANVGEPGEKFFEDLAIISTVNLSEEYIKQLINITVPRSIFQTKLQNVLDYDIEETRRKLITAVKEGELREVQKILSLSKSDIKKRLLIENGGRKTVLHFAVDAKHNQNKIIKEIFSSFSSDQEFLKALLLWPDWDNKTTFDLAAEQGYIDIVQLFLEKCSEDKYLSKELLLIRSSAHRETAIELAHRNNHSEIVNFILKFAIDKCIEVIEDLASAIGGIYTAVEYLKSSNSFDHIKRLFNSIPQFKQIFDLLNAVKENQTNIEGLLVEIEGNYDTTEKLLQSKDSNGNTFFVLSFQKKNENAINFIAKFLKNNIYFAYDYLASDDFKANTINEQIDIFNWVEANFGKEYSFPGQKALVHVVSERLKPWLTSERKDNFELFLDILIWANSNCREDIFVDLMDNAYDFAFILSDHWENPTAAFVMKLLLDFSEERPNIRYPYLMHEYASFEYISEEIIKYASYEPNDIRLTIFERWKLKLEQIVDAFVDDDLSVSKISENKETLVCLKFFVNKFYSGQNKNDKGKILAKIGVAKEKHL